MATTKSKAATAQQLVDVSRAIGDALERVTKQTVAKVKDLEARVAELEQVRMVASPFRKGDVFEPGAHVVVDGALFKCVQRTAERPSRASDCWQAISAGAVYYYLNGKPR